MAEDAVADSASASTRTVQVRSGERSAHTRFQQLQTLIARRNAQAARQRQERLRESPRVERRV